MALHYFYLRKQLWKNYDSLNNIGDQWKSSNLWMDFGIILSFIKYSTNCNNRHGFVIIRCNSKLVAWFTLNLVCIFIETYLKILITNSKDQILIKQKFLSIFLRFNFLNVKNNMIKFYSMWDAEPKGLS